MWPLTEISIFDRFAIRKQSPFVKIFNNNAYLAHHKSVEGYLLSRALNPFQFPSMTSLKIFKTRSFSPSSPMNLLKDPERT